MFAQAGAAAGDDVIALMNLAMFRAHQWRWGEAERLATRAMTGDPTHAEIFRVLAECALTQKRSADASDLAPEALRPVLPRIDWIIETDRSGPVGLPSVIAAQAWAL
jgi:hypothetical protein